nr:MAG TPA: hypothetical protein [Caudoviricetes sp.]
MRQDKTNKQFKLCQLFLIAKIYEFSKFNSLIF